MTDKSNSDEIKWIFVDIAQDRATKFEGRVTKSLG